MYMFVKAMYDAWCDGQDALEQSNRYKVFVSLASRQLHRAENEMEEYLKTQPWFKYPKELS